MRGVLKTIGFLIGGTICGYLFLVLVFCLPLGRIHNNVLESSNSFSDEYTILVEGNETTKLDDYTDALMLLTAENHKDRNPFTGSIYAYHLWHESQNPNKIISELDNASDESRQYSRYWHGYLIFLKPLLVFFNYSQIQIMLSFIVIGLIIGVIFLMQKKKMNKYIIPYIIAIAIMSPATISLSMQYVSVFTICNISIIFLLLFAEKIQKKNNIFYIFLAIGMLTCYFDLLTYPIVTLGFPLLIWLILLNEKKASCFAENLKQIFLNGVAWSIGYFGIWVGKWLLGSIVTGDNLFISAMKAASIRSSSVSSVSTWEINRFSGIGYAFENIFSEPTCFILVMIIAIIAILYLLKKIRFNKKKLIDNLWILIVGIIPIVWLIVLANHSTWHNFFTYRTATILIFATGCYFASALEVRKSDIRRRKKWIK